MLIAQLSDSHIRVGPLAAEAATSLHRALGRVLGLRPTPDCVILTGDVVDNGMREEYAAFRAIAADYPLPIHLVAGNHDDAATLVTEFGGTSFLGGGESAYYAVRYPTLTLIALDSSEPGRLDGHLEQSQLDWLDRTLSERPDVPAVIGLHHPPVEVGMAFLDSIRLDNAEALDVVLRRHPQVIQVLAGHIHRAITATFADRPLAIAPSTFRQAALDLCTHEPTGYVHEPPGFLLHLLDGRRPVTHLVPTLDAGGPVGHY